MRASYPPQVVMKPLYACNIGCGSTGFIASHTTVILRGSLED